MKNIDINKIVVFDKLTFGEKGFKCFIGYKNAKIRPLCRFLSKCLHVEMTLMKLNICLFG